MDNNHFSEGGHRLTATRRHTLKSRGTLSDPIKNLKRRCLIVIIALIIMNHSHQTRSFERCCHQAAMSEFHVDDQVRIDIPDETDPDHERGHGEHGQIVDILEDEAGTLTGDERGSTIYRVAFSTGEELDLRHQSIRPPIE